MALDCSLCKFYAVPQVYLAYRQECNTDCAFVNPYKLDEDRVRSLPGPLSSLLSGPSLHYCLQALNNLMLVSTVATA